jgi:hypothetical protein
MPVVPACRGRHRARAMVYQRRRPTGDSSGRRVRRAAAPSRRVCAASPQGRRRDRGRRAPHGGDRPWTSACPRSSCCSRIRCAGSSRRSVLRPVCARSSRAAPPTTRRCGGGSRRWASPGSRSPRPMAAPGSRCWTWPWSPRCWGRVRSPGRSSAMRSPAWRLPGPETRISRRATCRSSPAASAWEAWPSRRRAIAGSRTSGRSPRRAAARGGTSSSCRSRRRRISWSSAPPGGRCCWSSGAPRARRPPPRRASTGRAAWESFASRMRRARSSKEGLPGRGGCGTRRWCCSRRMPSARPGS